MGIDWRIPYESIRRSETTYLPPEDIFYRGKYFKIDSIDTVGDSIHGDTEITIHAQAYNNPYWPLTMPNDKYAIKKITINPNKNATTVIFKDGDVVVVKKAPEDPEADIYSVVAYAVAKHVYGSNSALKREIKGKIEKIKK